MNTGTLISEPIATNNTEDESVAKIKALKSKTIDALYITWANENLSNGVRTLALRTALLQAVENGKYALIETGQSIERLFCIGNTDDSKNNTFSLTLRQRPKLLEEVFTELQYVLSNYCNENDKYASATRKELATLIEEVVSCLKTESEIEEIWKFHPIHSDDILSPTQKIKVMVQLCSNDSNLPDTIKDATFKTLEKMISKETAKKPKILVIRKSSKDATYLEEHPLVSALVKEIIEKAKSSSDTVLLERLLTLIENQIPNNQTFLPPEQLKTVIASLPPYLLRLIVLRHVRHYSDDELNRLDRESAYWLTGILTVYTCERGLISKLTASLISRAKDAAT